MTGARYRAAVVGCGRIGVLMEEDPRQPRPATHAGAFASNDRIELAALVEPDAARLAHATSLFAGVAGFSDCRSMLKSVEPEIVAVATPPETHRAVVEMCAEGGVRAIVCEKPIAHALEDARRMVETCARAGTMLFVNHTRRFDPEIRRVREDLASGALGEVLQASCYYTAGIANTGTHLVDLLRFLLGDPAWVAAVPNPRSACPPGDEQVDGLIEFDCGTRATLQSLDVRDYSIFDIHLYGRRGTLALTRYGFEVERAGLRLRADVSGYRELDLDGRVREGKPRSLMQAVAQHVADCLDGLDRPVSRGEDGVAALEMVVALRASALRGGARVALGPSWRIP